MFRKTSFLCLIYVAVSFRCAGQQPSSMSPFPLKKLDSIVLQDVPPRAPGIASAIISKGKVSYERYAGYADFQDSSLIGPDTRFNIASNGKQFTALAILDLEAKKKLRLQDDIRKYLPEMFARVSSPITIAQLLNHTSGIRDVYDLWSMQGKVWWQDSMNNRQVLDLLSAQRELNFEPGTAFLYSNSNYILLAQLIEKVTGRSFTAVTDELFHRLNMPNTSFESDHRKIRGPIARAYFNFGEWTTFNWTWDVCGDGNLFSTLRDQAEWEMILQGKSNTSISRSLIRKSQQALSQTTFTNYGYGLELSTYRGFPARFHEGATGAWKATTLRIPGRELSILTLTNSGKAIPAQQTRQAADLLLGLPADQRGYAIQPATTGTPVKPSDMAGVYLTEGNFAFRIVLEDDRVLLKRSGRNDVELVQQAANIFRQKTDTAFLQEFTRLPDGTLQLTVYYPSHAPYSLKQVRADWTGFSQDSVTGDFVNDETGCGISIRSTGSQREYEVKIGGNETTKGIMLSPTSMLVDSYLLKFKAGTVRLDGERIKNVLFAAVNK